MDMTMVTFTFVGFIFLCTISLAYTGGRGSLKLLTYDNPTQQLASGQCCDHFLSSNCVRDQCDPKFLVCLKQRSSSHPCSLLRQESYIFNDTTTVSFANMFGTSSSNPLHFNFTSWKSGFSISVTVADFDSGGSSATMDIITHTETVTLAAGPVSNGLSLKGSRGRLRLEYTLECDPGYYGDCSSRCAAINNSYCTPSGTVACLPGFTGSDCNTDIDECQSNPCDHGGTCTNGNNSYTCVCPYGRTGPNCNIAVSTTQITTQFTTTLTSTSGSISSTVSSTIQPSTVSNVTSVTSSMSRSSLTSTTATTSITTTTTGSVTSFPPNQTNSTPISTKPTNGSSSQYIHSRQQSPETGDDNTGAVVGGVVGGVVALLVVLLVAGYFIRKYIIKKKMAIGNDLSKSTNCKAKEGELTASITPPPVDTVWKGQV
ncbi:protein jagged-1-like [Argopecten irradians]|uniref:protein jagged-1-like n=1 Tax=Argopecten irradians TaxID=31199 RepID=UPI003724BD0F